MRTSPKQALPLLAALLIRRHADEWVAGTRGSLSFGLQRGVGYFVILRAPKLGTQRLASALLPTQNFRTLSDWTSLWEVIGGTRSLIHAKNMYVVVPGSISEEAKAEVDRHRIELVRLETLV
jgi:hypothetical protein